MSGPYEYSLYRRKYKSGIPLTLKKKVFIRDLHSYIRKKKKKKKKNWNVKTNEKQGETYRFHCMYFGVRQNTASRDNNAYPSYFGNGNKSLGMLESIEVVRIGLEIEPLLLGTRELGVIAKFHYTRARTKRAREGSFVVLIGVRDRKNMFGSTACLYDRM